MTNKTDDSPFVFTTPKGKPIDTHYISQKRWYPTLKKAGLNVDVLMRQDIQPRCYISQHMKTRCISHKCSGTVIRVCYLMCMRLMLQMLQDEMAVRFRR
jgi:hypothetical protein